MNDPHSKKRLQKTSCNQNSPKSKGITLFNCPGSQGKKRSTIEIIRNTIPKATRMHKAHYTKHREHFIQPQRQPSNNQQQGTARQAPGPLDPSEFTTFFSLAHCVRPPVRRLNRYWGGVPLRLTSSSTHHNNPTEGSNQLIPPSQT